MPASKAYATGITGPPQAEDEFIPLILTKARVEARSTAELRRIGIARMDAACRRAPSRGLEPKKSTRGAIEYSPTLELQKDRERKLGIACAPAPADALATRRGLEDPAVPDASVA